MLKNYKSFFSILFFCFFLLPVAFAQDRGDSVQGAIDAYNAGGSYGHISTANLIAARDSSSASQGAKDSFSREIQSRDIAAKVQIAHEAENAVCEAIKEISEAQETLDKLQAQYDSMLGDASEPMNDTKKSMLDKAREAVIYQQTTVEELQGSYSRAIENMQNAYTDLAATYAKYNITGDPVSLRDGSFIAEYTDFIAQDFLEKFSVKRNFNKDGFSESFGDGWNCSLDSRIIRCNVDDNLSPFIEICETALQEIENIKEKIESTITAYEFIGKPALSGHLEKFIEQEKQWQELYEYLQKQSEILNNTNELNQFAAYGRYKNISEHWGSPDYLLYLDENGIEFLFRYDKNGVWKNQVESFPDAISIISYGSTEEERIYNPDKYVVTYKNGVIKEYSGNGILSKENDRNGNITEYTSENGKITSIKLKTGEVISVVRNSNGYITSISGTVSGTTKYTYSGSKLSKVCDTQGIVVTYSYDNYGALKTIGKADGSSVSIIYGNIKDESNNNVRKVTSVINENGQEEYFYYYLTTNGLKIIHTDVAGGQEIYELNCNGNTVYAKEANGTETIFKYNSDGLISSQITNGNEKKFSYNTEHQLTKVLSSGGGTDSYEYNKWGFVTKHTDGDGFYESWNYDSKGNVTDTYFHGNKVSGCQYYGNGLLKTLREDNKVVTYEYNSYGSVTCKKVTGSKYAWENITENWKYDKQNRPVSYSCSDGSKISWKYMINKYGTVDETEIRDNRIQIETKRDMRNRVYNLTVSDLKSGDELWNKFFRYDKRDNILEISVSKNTLTEYKYLPDNRLSSYIIWNNCGNESAFYNKQGIKATYDYDSHNYLEKVKLEVVSDISNDDDSLPVKKGQYLILNNKSYLSSKGEITIETLDQANKVVQSYVYDSEGRLIKENHIDGFSKNRIFSKAGRLLTESDSNGKRTNFNYKSDGTKEVEIIDELGNQSVYFYDESGLVSKIVNAEGEIFQYEFDSNGNLVLWQGPGFYSSCNYDSKGRKTQIVIKDQKGKTVYNKKIVYDDENFLEYVYLNGKKRETIERNVIGQIIKISNCNGNYAFKYDYAGNIIEIYKNKKLNCTAEYTGAGKIARIEYADGTIELNRYLPTGECFNSQRNGQVLYQCDFDGMGKPVSIQDAYGNSTDFSYDSNGLVKKIVYYDTGLKEFSVNKSKKTVTQKDSKGNSFISVYNSKGQVVEETNQNKKKASYKYDKNGNLIWKKDFTGKTTFYDYSFNDNSVKTETEDGSYSYIQTNPLGLCTKLQNQDNSFVYEYDASGLMTKSLDENSNLEVTYVYNDEGQCIEKKSTDFQINYEWGTQGELVKLTEKNSGVWINFEYDKTNSDSEGKFREIKRIFSNGNTTSFYYDSKKRKNGTVTRNHNGEIVFAEFIVFDQKNRVQAVMNEKGFVTEFQYDSSGRLSKTSYPYSQEYRNFYYKEAVECGNFCQEDEVQGINKNLSAAIVADFQKQVLAAGLGTVISVQRRGEVWEEIYTYDCNGNISSTENQFGKIIYEYDAQNRLISKHSAVTSEYGMNFKWDDNGNMTLIKTQWKEISFIYNAFNRPVVIKEQNLVQGTECIYEYTYDACGRRISETVNSSYQKVWHYDGLSSAPLFCSVKSQASSSNYSEQKSSAVDFRLPDFTFSSWETQRTPLGSTEISSQNFNRLEENRDSQQWRTDDFITGDSVDSRKVYEDRPVVYLSYDSAQLERVYLEKNSMENSKIEVLIQNYKNQIVLSFDRYSDCCQKSVTDTWGNIISGFGINKGGFSEASLVLNTDFLLYDLGQRDYSPLLKCFTTEDPSRDGNNWFAFSPGDPVNYEDCSGFFKKDRSMEDNAKAAAAIAKFAGYSKIKQRQNKGGDCGIPKDYDCADVAAFINYTLDKEIGINSSSPIAKDFADAMKTQDVKDEMMVIFTGSYFGEDNKDGKNMVKTSSDLSDLKNPLFVSPGTNVVFKDNKAHVLTIIARRFDDKGNVVGFVYIEGHKAYEKLTEIGYCSVDGSYEKNDISMWAYDSTGHNNYDGTYEFSTEESYNNGNGCLK